MAKWAFNVANFTTNANADGNAFTDNTYMGLMGGSTTQMIDILEVEMAGLAAASAPQIMQLSRDSVVQATPTALTTGQSNGALHPATAALGAPQVAFTASTTKPNRAATLAKLNLGFNAFGGQVRWLAGPGEQFTILGNTASLGEASLSGFTGTTAAAISAHLVYEPY